MDSLASWDIETVIPGHGDPGSKRSSSNKEITWLICSCRSGKALNPDFAVDCKNWVKSGKSKETLVNEIDLSKHPVRGQNKTSNIRSIRAMYDKLKAATGNNN